MVERSSASYHVSATMEQETYRRLLPGYVGRFLENAAPLVDIGIEGDMHGVFPSARSSREA